MKANKLAGLTKQQLRTWLTVFFLALSIPTGVLIYQAYQQLKWEAFYQTRIQAEELTNRISDELITALNIEESRSFTDYSFLNVAGEPDASFIQRSPLSAYPPKDTLPGMVGYFQIDTRGKFSSPLLPEPGSKPKKYGISTSELKKRQASVELVKQILSDNKLVVARLSDTQQNQSQIPAAEPEIVQEGFRQNKTYQSSESNTLPSSPTSVSRDRTGESKISSAETGKQDKVPAQAAFDQLEEKTKRQKHTKKSNTIGRVEDYKLESPYKDKVIKEKTKSLKIKKEEYLKKRAPRKERSALPEQDLQSQGKQPVTQDKITSEIRIRIFESEIDSYEINLLDSGHFVMYRKVWRNNQRYIQGFLLEPKIFFNKTIAPAYYATSLSESSNLAVAYHGDIFSIFRGNMEHQYQTTSNTLDGNLLAQTRLPAPFDNIELVFTLTHLPAGLGGKIIIIVSLILILVFIAGFYLMYRLGLGQINLARQQQDFVSAVSHELKTPLTSIRMYSEILKQGWANEKKQKTYFNYIHDESERLSRLISNVLQLARMTRNTNDIDLQPLTIQELLDIIHSKVSTQVESVGFKLNIDCNERSTQATVNADADYFSQIIINLVDNALKFAKGADNQSIDLKCTVVDNKLIISVRDYGPGIEATQLKSIFKLFYRAENELTRETVGTGIGLALVRQLVVSMGGEIAVKNVSPGAEFLITLPLVA